MKIRTHYLIAKIAIKDNKKLNKFQKLMFCIGSLLPDLTPNQVVHPHFYENSKDYIFKKIDELKGKKISFMTAISYGKMAHYLSDFCCTAHKNGPSVKNCLWHINYEKEINKFAINNSEKLKISFKKINNFSTIHEILDSFYKSEKSTYKNDLLLSIKACSLLI